MPLNLRETKSLLSLQHVDNKSSPWDSDDDDDDHDKGTTSRKSDSSSGAIFTLSNGIAVRPLRRTDAPELYKHLNDPKIARSYPDTVYPHPFSMWRVHKLIDEALDQDKQWRQQHRAPSKSSSSSGATGEPAPAQALNSIYEQAVAALADLDLEERMAKLEATDKPLASGTSRSSTKGTKQDAKGNQGTSTRAKLLPVDYAITSNDTLIGYINLDFSEPLVPGSRRIDASDPSDPGFMAEAELCYWLAAEHRNRGIMTAVLRLFLDWAWENFAQLERIGAAVYATWNAESGAVLGKLGFAREGTWVGGIRKGGRWGNLEQWVLYREGGLVERSGLLEGVVDGK